MSVFTIFVGIVISGCSGITLPGLQTVQTDDNFAKIFGIVPGADKYQKAVYPEVNIASIVSMKENEAVQIPKTKVTLPPEGNIVLSRVPTGNLATAMDQLSKMSALQLLKSLGIKVPNIIPNIENNNNKKTPHSQNNKQVYNQRMQHVSEQQHKPIVKNPANSKYNEVLTDGLKGGDRKNEPDQNIQVSQQKQSGAKFNSQQQISPLYMMNAGMGRERFSHVSNQEPSISNQSKNKLFDPDALMHHMMMSSTSSLGTGNYDLKQNMISSQRWSKQQTGSQPIQSGGKLTAMNSMFGQKSVDYNPGSLNNALFNFKPDALLLPGSKKTPETSRSFNPDSFNNAKVNFKPNALLVSVHRDTSKHSGKFSYDPDKLNIYSGSFNPGQMFPVVGINTPPPSHPAFNADTVNQKLINSKQNLERSSDLSDIRYSKDRPEFDSEVTLRSDKYHFHFVPGLLYPGFTSDLRKLESASRFSIDKNAATEEIIQPLDSSLDLKTVLHNAFSNVPINSVNSTLNLTTAEPTTDQSSRSKITNTTQITTGPSLSSTPATAEKYKTDTLVGGGSIQSQQSNLHGGFVPGSLTGDGRTLQMMVNNGMFDPNRVNLHTFHLDENSASTGKVKRNKTTQQIASSFNMPAKFDPSSVNQVKVSFNTNQQMGMDGSSGFVGSNYNPFYDANKVNQNSFINPFDRVETNKTNMSLGGMFDNSQFLGNFDPNNVNLESRNGSGNSMKYAGFGGGFNPTEVNKAFFNPDEVNKAHMNFNPSEMLEKNPGYDKDTAESYHFDPNKVNDIHMNFIPPFIQDNSNKNKSNSTRPRFIPGLLSGGGKDFGVFDPSKMKGGILFYPLEMMKQPTTNNSIVENKSNSSETGSGSLGKLKDFMSGNQFNPNALNKVNNQFNPSEMMKLMMENRVALIDNKNNNEQLLTGHENHKKAN